MIFDAGRDEDGADQDVVQPRGLAVWRAQGEGGDEGGGWTL